jgi:hypothetical protein
MDQTKRFNGVGEFFQLLFFQLLSLPLPAIDNNGVDFDRVKFAGCHFGTRTIVDGFGDETVRHRASFRSSRLGALARLIGEPPGLAGKLSTNRLRLAVVMRADFPILTASSLPSRISS